ncbi:PepSY-associated TM helix domain-containing protein [Giesbergeria sinuosa]|uniref:PepSY-associated TM helix domain-containing protein n=1 Tax=Giesbergeria sinuosa TaxID=80883 RepID=A0ABV9QAH2_9BURK
MPAPARQAISSKMPNDREGVRQAMSWLHTWAGLLLGWLLFAIFFAGTLSFFKNEFNLWMRPEMYGLPAADAEVAQKSLDALTRQFPALTQWIMHLPDERNPAVGILWRDTGNGRFETLHMNPQTGEAIATRPTMGGDFFYRFHFELRTAQKGRWTLEGRWLVGVATMLMLVALITGVITHRRIFKDFFTFRPAKGGQRAWLDAHNVSGVLVLPFYLMITFSGLMIFHTMYMPAGIATVYQTQSGVDANTYLAQLQGENPANRPPRGGHGPLEPLPAIALKPIINAATAYWQGGRIGSLQARRDAQGHAVVEVTRHEGDRLQYRPPRLVFNATTGQRLEHADPSSPAAKTYGVLYGLHLARFADIGMRWALFGFGVLGCLMIATGLVLWSVKRSAKVQPSQVPFGQRLVMGLNIATLAGLPLACGVYLAANRLLPVDIKGRADVELAWFFGAWGLVLLWGLACTVWRPSRMGWSAPLGVAGLVWAMLPLLNALTTHTHLGVTLPAQEWMWAGMDLSFLAAGMAWGWLSWRLRPGRCSPTRQGQNKRAHTGNRGATLGTSIHVESLKNG